MTLVDLYNSTTYAKMRREGSQLAERSEIVQQAQVDAPGTRTINASPARALLLLLRRSSGDLRRLREVVPGVPAGQKQS